MSTIECVSEIILRYYRIGELLTGKRCIRLGRMDSNIGRTIINRLVFAGVTTEVCVYPTLQDAVEREYECMM